ncbi:VTT domain-containing protein [Actinomycetospora straminea]|uniref:VTT domain-containing protein n=1 Tax=Actinomycetospora straminea TaxID=663607 RepID=A0ABP9EGU2_9PSEU|nr:VTT domain-containing protein [Actinomycetospora straminea]MDD7933745.1 VTT domain-containing protein [Actinomycetospora straminea]
MTIPIERVLVWAAVPAVLVVVPFLLWGSDVVTWTASVMSPTTSSTAIAVGVFLLLAVDIAAPVPSSLVCLAAGALLGAALGTAVSAAGLSVGCAVGLGLARRVGSTPSRWLLGPEPFDRLRRLGERHGVAILAVCRPVPVLAETSVVMAGAVRMPLSAALAVTTLANIGVAGCYAVAGAWAWSGRGTFPVAVAAACLLPAAAWSVVLAARRRVTAADR